MTTKLAHGCFLFIAILLLLLFALLLYQEPAGATITYTDDAYTAWVPLVIVEAISPSPAARPLPTPAPTDCGRCEPTATPVTVIIGPTEEP